MSKKREILIGQKYGNFTVISDVFVHNGIRKVQCRCGCGKITNLYCCNIKDATRCKACAKSNRSRKYNIGDNINDFIILSHNRLNNKTLYKCQCKCGNIIHCSSSTLKKTKECRSCFNRKSGINHPLYKGTDSIPGHYLSTIKLRAKNKNIDFDLSIEYIDELIKQQNFKCKLSGIEISVFDGTASLDRIDPKKGYIANNVQWLHKDVNVMKWDFSKEYLIELCEKILRYNNNG